jgi:hypothetical protein
MALTITDAAPGRGLSPTWNTETTQQSGLFPSKNKAKRFIFAQKYKKNADPKYQSTCTTASSPTLDRIDVFTPQSSSSLIVMSSVEAEFGSRALRAAFPYLEVGSSLKDTR